MRHLILTAALLPLAACHPGAGADAGKSGAAPVQVTDAVCRPTPPGRHSTGCYLTLVAGADDRLVAVTSPNGTRVQIHESRMESNMMMMRELKEGLPLPARQTVALAPGGNHLMVLGLKDGLAAGAALPLHLSFANAAGVDVSARVGDPAAAEDHAGH